MESTTEEEEEDEGMREGKGVEGLSVGLSSGKVARLVDWNFDVLARLLKQIIAKARLLNEAPEVDVISAGWARDLSDGRTVLDEVKETIALPPFHAKMGQLQHEADQIELDEDVSSQLHEFIANLAAMYHDNPFHNFEHASHVTMSVSVCGFPIIIFSTVC